MTETNKLATENLTLTCFIRDTDYEVLLQRLLEYLIR